VYHFCGLNFFHFSNFESLTVKQGHLLLCLTWVLSDAGLTVTPAMHFLQILFGIAPLWVASSLALSDQAQNVLDSISTISKAAEANQNAINVYRGGMMAAIPVAQRNYDTWNSLRTAYVNLPNTQFTAVESNAIVQSYTAVNQASLTLLDTYRQKAPMLHQAGVGFMVPIMMQALFKQADDLSAALTECFPEQYQSPMEQIVNDHTAAWNAAFAAFDPGSNSEPSQNYGVFISTISPILGLLI